MGKRNGFIKGEIEYAQPGKENYFIHLQLLAGDLKIVRTRWTKKRTFTFIRVKPGVYLLCLLLPSGAKMEQIIEVEAGQKTMALFDMAAYGPEESHQWAYLSKDTRLDYNMRPVEKNRNTIEFYSISGYLWSLVHGKWETASLANMQTQFITEPGISYIFPVDDHLHALEIRGDTIASQIVYLPSGTTIKCLLRPASIVDEWIHRLKVIISSEYTQAETLLTLFSRGGYDEARLIYPSDKKLKLPREGNPTEAIIRCYYLIKTKAFDVAKREVETFADTFNRIPDTAIIFAWRLTFLKPGEFRVLEFGDWLTRAWKRGVPIYTAGLVLLFNGLKYLNSHYKTGVNNDYIINEVRKAFSEVEELVGNADLNQELTTVFGSNPGSINPPRQNKMNPGNVRPSGPSSSRYSTRKQSSKSKVKSYGRKVPKKVRPTSV